MKQTIKWKCRACGATGSSTITTGNQLEAGRIAAAIHYAVSTGCRRVDQVEASFVKPTPEEPT